jgi:hypothetical protein
LKREATEGCILGEDNGFVGIIRLVTGEVEGAFRDLREEMGISVPSARRTDEIEFSHPREVCDDKLVNTSVNKVLCIWPHEFREGEGEGEWNAF